jgi:putative transposase
MKYDPEKHRRRSIRLNGYDYKQTGAYFITICTRERPSFFGAICGGEMRFTNAGRIADTAWQELPSRFPSLRLDAFIVMPNHVHGIIVVAQFIAPQITPSHDFGKIKPDAINRAPALGELIRAYKAVSTRLIRREATPDFAWQRNYYEHVVRDEESLDENPAATAPEPEDAWRGEIRA